MTTKTDLMSLSLTTGEKSACHAKAINGPQLLLAAQESAADLSCQIGELLKVLPAGSNKTALAAIQTALQ